MESQVTKYGGAVRSSHAVFVYSILGATISGSFSHVPGLKHLVKEPIHNYISRGRANAPKIDVETYEGGCSVGPRLANEIRLLNIAVFRPINNSYTWRNIEVHILLVPPKIMINKKHYLINFNNNVSLMLYYACTKKTQKRDVFYAYLQSMHEVSHVMANLKNINKKGKIHGVSKNEILAEGGPACIYRRLRSLDDPLKLSHVLSERVYFNASWETNVMPVHDRKTWCTNWIDAFSSEEKR